ncbi:AaceriADR380Wp [[Ashbya] aceris (nom. inval.)]|nr:AaceriADR380Wp [[Ashbya] aceris (nom. inval.)]
MAYREMNGTGSTPRTPEHAGPDQDIHMKEVKRIPEQEMLDLELNPDLESDGGDEGEVGQEEEDSKGHTAGTQSSKRTLDDSIDEVFDHSADFQPRINVHSPFASTEQLSQAGQRPTQSRRRLSSSQQSKFVSYCDEQLMYVQRKMVQNRGLNVNQGYASLVDLILDLKKLVDFIWFSIDGCSNTEVLLGQGIERRVAEDYEGTQNTNFGQSYYLIRISDDFLDYMDKFSLEELDDESRRSTLSRLFKMLLILDKIFARLIDGAVPGQYKLSGTDKVRLSGIAERTRVKVPNMLERAHIRGYHYEVTKIYEETLDRCG